MEEIFVYLYFFVGAIFLSDLRDEESGGYRIVPARIVDTMRILMDFLLERETRIAIRNKGYMEISVSGSDFQYIEYIKDNYEVKILEGGYMAWHKPNLFSTLPPRFPLKLKESVVLDFLRYSVLGDTLTIETMLHKSSIRDLFLLGKKRFQLCLDVNIYTPFLLRRYGTFGTLQELVLEKGYKLVLTTDEIQSLLWGDITWTSGQLIQAKK